MQDTIDSKLDKRKKGVFGPPLGKRFIIYVDDLNMPKKEEYGAQPPIEILRQWFDQRGWFDRKALTFRSLVDMVYTCSMGPPGGGRNPITDRFVRHFNVVGYAEMSNHSKEMIFSQILSTFLSSFDPAVAQLCDGIVQSTTGNREWVGQGSDRPMPAPEVS